jgi:2'-5' RNA ligase
MGYSFELYFEPWFEENIKTLWKTLAQAGIPSFYERIGGRPHFTLAICEQADESRLSPLLGAFSRTFSAFAINFPAIAFMPGKQCVVYLAPVITSILLDVHASMYTLLEDNGCAPLDRYSPSSWLPHCPISKELSYKDAMKTMELCAEHRILGTTQAIELGYIKMRPSRPVQVWPLGIS